MAPKHDRGGSLTTWLVLLPHNAHIVMRRFKITFSWNAVLLMRITYLSRDSCRNLICKNLVFFHMSKGNVFKTVIPPLRCLSLWCKMLGKKTEVILCEDLVLINYLTCKLVDTYPAVNQNGLSDRTLPLVEVICVLKQLYPPPPPGQLLLRHKSSLCSNDFVNLPRQNVSEKPK